MSSPRCEPREDADQSKDPRRGADGAMPRAVVHGIREVAEGATYQKREQRAADAEAAGKGSEEEAPEQRIPSDVAEVGVKREGRNRAPSLPGQDEHGLAIPKIDEERVSIRCLKP